jgi:hypothetical protein
MTNIATSYWADWQWQVSSIAIFQLSDSFDQALLLHRRQKRPDFRPASLRIHVIFVEQAGTDLVESPWLFDQTPDIGSDILHPETEPIAYMERNNVIAYRSMKSLGRSSISVFCHDPSSAIVSIA